MPGKGGLSGDHPRGQKAVETRVVIGSLEFDKYKSINTTYPVYAPNGCAGIDGLVIYKFEKVQETWFK